MLNNEMEKDTKVESEAPPKSRLLLGGLVFVTGFLSPLLIPLVVASDLSTGIKSVISGLLAVGVPEVFILIAAAILGKSGFSYLKTKLFGWLKKYGPPDTVSQTRYRTGLIVFLIPVVSGFIIPYIWDLVPFIRENLLWIVISGDVLLLISLFILGGDFWDKLRSLFIYRSRAIHIDDQKISHDKKNTSS